MFFAAGELGTPSNSTVSMVGPDLNLLEPDLLFHSRPPQHSLPTLTILSSINSQAAQMSVKMSLSDCLIKIRPHFYTPIPCSR